MAVKQYIGARYVPKFFENANGTSDWVQNVSYEALTIVTRNGNSYTSKKPVPSYVGAPESNTEYWAPTGVFSEQFNAVNERINEVIDGYQEADTAIVSRMTGLIETEKRERVSNDNQLRTDISSEASARAAADTAIQVDLEAEETARENADTLLQNQIDQIVAPSGEAPNPAEITNARIGYDDTVYSSLGIAIRTQITDIRDTALITRPALTANDDLNDTDLLMGVYLKPYGVTVANGVNSARARIVYYRGDGISANVQIWFDTTSNIVYYRMKDQVDRDWSKWSVWNNFCSVDLELTDRVALAEATGTLSSGTSNLTRTVSSMNRYDIENADKITVDWKAINIDGNGNRSDKLYTEFYTADDVKLQHVIRSAESSEDVTSSITIPANAKYVSFFIFNAGGETLPYNKIRVTVYGINNLTAVKHGKYGSNQNGSRWYRFGYKVGEKIDANNNITNIFNTGVFMCPPNYTSYGKALPLIVMVHGSDAYKSIYADPIEITAYNPYINFLCDCGFGVIDCYGWTRLYDSRASYTEGGQTLRCSNPWPIPTTVKAYESAINVILDAFNFDRNNVFVMCKSLGGQVASLLSAKMNIRAAGLLAPALQMNFGYANAKYRELIGEDLGIEGVINNDLGWTTKAECLADFRSNYLNWSAEKKMAFYLGNEQNIAGWSSEFMNTTGAPISERFEYNANNNAAGATDYCKVSYPPTKIWVAQDDTAINVAMCGTYAQQIRNGGGVGIVRYMPNGTGGHNSVDSSPLAERIDSVTTPLGITHTDIPVAYYELYKFFADNMR